MEKFDNFFVASAVEDYIMMSVMISQYRHFNLLMNINEDVINKRINDARHTMINYKYDVEKVDDYLNKYMPQLIKLPRELYPPLL
jgi:nitrogen regulatory protein PII-like uncharacterized protein